MKLLSIGSLAIKTGDLHYCDDDRSDLFAVRSPASLEIDARLSSVRDAFESRLDRHT